MSAAGSTRPSSLSDASRGGWRRRPWICPDLHQEIAANSGLFMPLYRRKLAGIIPRPASRPLSETGPGEPANADQASGFETRQGEKSRETEVDRKETGRENSRSQSTCQTRARQG